MTLTPYDTGEVLQPIVWRIDPSSGQFDMKPMPEAEKRERYGKVDFDNDESATILTIKVDRNDGEGGGYALHIWPHFDDHVEVIIHQEEM